MRLCIAAAAIIAPTAATAHSPWILVDTNSATLSVMRGHEVIQSYPDLAIGRGGVSERRTRGDDSTPLGEFRVVEVRTNSNYHRFYLFDFPNNEHANRAWNDGRIDLATYDTIVRAVKNHRLPPQNTALGGNLGIHGLGDADPGIHSMFNWTNGCIALTNEQIDALSPWLRVGTKVVVQ